VSYPDHRSDESGGFFYKCILKKKKIKIKNIEIKNLK